MYFLLNMSVEDQQVKSLIRDKINKLRDQNKQLELHNKLQIIERRQENRVGIKKNKDNLKNKGTVQ